MAHFLPSPLVTTAPADRQTDTDTEKALQLPGGQTNVTQSRGTGPLLGKLIFHSVPRDPYYLQSGDQSHWPHLRVCSK